MKKLKIFQVFLLMILSLITGQGLISRGRDTEINHKEAKVEIGDFVIKGAGVATAVYVGNKIRKNGKEKHQQESVEISIVEKKPEEVDQYSIVVEQRKQEKEIADEEESPSEISTDEESNFEKLMEMSESSTVNDEDLKEKQSDQHSMTNDDNIDFFDDGMDDKYKKNLIDLLRLNRFARKTSKVDNLCYFVNTGVAKIASIRFRYHSDKDVLALRLTNDLVVELELQNQFLSAKYSNQRGSLSDEDKKTVIQFIKNIDSEGIYDQIVSVYTKKSPSNKELNSQLDILRKSIGKDKKLVGKTISNVFKEMINAKNISSDQSGDFLCWQDNIQVNGQILRVVGWNSRSLNIDGSPSWQKIGIFGEENGQKPLYTIEIGLGREYINTRAIVLDFTNGKHSFKESIEQGGYDNEMTGFLNEEKKDLIEYLKALNQKLNTL
jgi:galactitol-specific phosphotransferase system IIB component